MDTPHAPSPGPSSHGSDFARVYVWELPVRFFHWINAACILILTVTGLIIAHPPSIAHAAEAYQSYWFGATRFVHFATAYLFFWNFVFRIYWGFVGNQYANWKNFIPHRMSQLREVWKVLRVDILEAEKKPHLTVGHNALAYLTYFGTFLAFLVQVVTGFAMYTRMSDAWLPRLFSWALPLFGGDYGLHLWHYAIMWIFILFTFVHVYLVFYHDYVEGHGVMSSMVGGWKFVHKHLLQPKGRGGRRP